MYNNEIYDGLKHYASKESISSDSEVHLDLAMIYEPFKTEEDFTNYNADPVSKLLKIVAAGDAEEMRPRLEEFGPITFLENHFYEKE
jgi:hypothetical protein